MMKTHVQNPYTRSPQLFVHMTVEETQQLMGALEACTRLGACTHDMTENQRDAFEQLHVQLKYALATPAPHGLQGATP